MQWLGDARTRRWFLILACLWIWVAALWRAWPWLTAPHIFVWEGTAIVEGSVLPDRAAPALAWPVVQWDDGILSRSDTSPLWGPWTRGLLALTAWPRPVILRLVPVATWIIAGMVLWQVERRRGRSGQFLALGLWAWALPVAYYSTYGASLGPTLSLALVALCLAERVMGPACGWGTGVGLAVLLVLLTFGYSPGRLVAVGLLAVTCGWGAWHWRWMRAGHVGALAILLAACIFTGWWQRARWPLFVHARGETVFDMRFDRHQAMPGLSGEPPYPLVPYALGLMRQRWPELRRALAPAQRVWPWSQADPPPIRPYMLAMLPVMGLGIVRACWPGRRAVIWIALAASLPVIGGALLSTRVDSHRLALLAPVAVWLSCAGGAALPWRWVRGALAVGVLAGVWAEAPIPEPPVERRFAPQIERAFLAAPGERVRLLTSGIGNPEIAEGLLRASRRSGRLHVTHDDLEAGVAARQPTAFAQLCAAAGDETILVGDRDVIAAGTASIEAAGCRVIRMEEDVARVSAAAYYRN